MKALTHSPTISEAKQQQQEAEAEAEARSRSCETGMKENNEERT